MSEMVEVVIDSIRVSLMNQQRIVILREVGTERYLAIWIGVYEAEHLTIALQDVEVSRPLTYDLFTNVIESLNAQISHVEVVSLRDETFYGNVVLEVNGEVVNIDSRPSDAMNLAVRRDVPILVSREVMESAGITPDDDEVSIDDVGDVEVPSGEGDERLSVFEDFLDQLDIDESGDGEDDDDDKELE
jgi:bifunctional DNase/RNase